MFVVSFRLLAVTELILILHCETTNVVSVVEKRVKHDADFVHVSRIFARRSTLTHRLQLYNLGLTELPCELFRMKNLRRLDLARNHICSLPSEIAHLMKLEELDVRLSKRLDRGLTKSYGVSGLRQPAGVSSARARSADQSEGALRAALEADGS